MIIDRLLFILMVGVVWVGIVFESSSRSLDKWHKCGNEQD